MTSIVTDTRKNKSIQCDFNYKEIRRLDPYNYDDQQELYKCYVSKPNKHTGRVKVGIVYRKKKRGAKDDWGDDIYENYFSWLTDMSKKAWIEYKREIIDQFESSLSLLNNPIYVDRGINKQGKYCSNLDARDEFCESTFEYNNRIYFQKKI